MKKRKLCVFIIVICSFFVSLLLEIVLINHELLFKKSDKNPLIIEKYNIEKKNNYYVTTSKDSYLVIKTNINYINRIRFNYKYDKNFLWDYSYIENNEEKTQNELSSYIINTAIKKVDKNINIIKIHFNNKNIRINNIEIDNSIFIYWYRVLALTLLLSLLGILLLFYKEIKKVKKHTVFLFVSFVLGMSFIFITPKTVYISFDDQIHFSHSLNPFRKSEIKYSYAEELTEKGTFTREPIYFEAKEEKIEYYKYLNNIHRKTKNRVVQVSNERSFYGNIVYLPFYLGYKLSNCLNLNFITCFVIGKVFNLFLYSFLFYLAIKYSKYGKKVLFMIGLIPQCLFFATQYSYDSTIIAGLILATVCFINLISEERINKKYLLVFIFSVIWASLPKALYCPFMFLLLFIPNKKFDSKKQAIIFKSLIVLLTILILITFVLPAATGAMTADERGDNASVSGQISYVMSNPTTFAKTIMLFTLETGWENFLGSKNFLYLPYLVNVKYFLFMYHIYLFALMYYIFNSNVSKSFNKKYRILFLLEIVAIWLLFCVALYLKFTKVGLNTISGIHPRYMLPLFAAMSFLFIYKDKEIQSNDYLYVGIPIVYIFLIVLYLSVKVV